MATDPRLTPEHLRALSRRSFPFFCRGAFQELHPHIRISWNWHLDLIASRMQDVLEGRCQRLIVNIPPRYGKSLICSVSFPAFVLGHNPNAELICASYAERLSSKMARDTRKLMSSPFYHRVFGRRLASGRESLTEIKTPEGGYRLATSVEGTLTGRGGNFIIIDDAMKPTDGPSEVRRRSVNEWFDNTVLSRTNNKETDAIIVLMQRLHENDLPGHLLERGGWDHISLPGIAEAGETWTFMGPLGETTVHRREGEALHHARESLAKIAEQRASMTPYE